MTWAVHVLPVLQPHCDQSNLQLPLIQIFNTVIMEKHEAAAAPERGPSRAGQLRQHLRSYWFWGSVLVLVIFVIIMASLRVHLQVRIGVSPRIGCLPKT